MVFKRKIYSKILDWKNKNANKYSLLIEGARRVGKSTIVEEFAKQEYESYIMIDFSSANREIINCFDDVNDTSIFFLRLQATTGVRLIPGKSLIIFDEIQLFPKARQALKHLVKDSDYHYISTGSLISIKKNVKDILIPSEEKHIQMHPMDFEEFLWATNNDIYDAIEQLYERKKEVGNDLNRKLMRDFRIYMAVGGMPQAVEAYNEGKSFSEIDEVKRDIISLYENDFKKIDASGRLGAIYKSIPAQLSKNINRFSVGKALNKKKTYKDAERIFDLIDSKTVSISYNTSDPRVSLDLTKDLDSYKLYISDTGLFVTMLFMDRPSTENEIYAKLLSNKLPANLGYLYENAIAQVISSTDRELYYHTWNKENSTHKYEIDFLITNKTKINAIEVKSSSSDKHTSLDEFSKKYSKNIGDICIISQKDLQTKDGIKYIPVYMMPIYLEKLI